MRAGELALSATYFVYYGSIGVFQPYWPSYLSALGLTAGTIGTLLALFNAVRIAGPYLSARAADRAADPRQVLWLLALLAVAAALCLTQLRALVPLAAALALYSLASNALMPIVDALALQQLGADRTRYAWLRLWGSLGFILSSAAVGLLIGRLGPPLIPWAMAALLTATGLALARLPRVRLAPPAAAAGVVAAPPPAVGSLLRLLSIAFLHMTGFGAYYGFYTLYLAHYGYAPATVALYWSFAVAAELAMFLWAPALMRRFSLERLLQCALAGTVLRWALCALLPTSALWMFAAQALHMAGFALFHAVMVLLAPRLLPAGRRARAQALVAGVGWGAGGIAGSLLAGALWSTLGPRAVYVGALAVALLAFGLSLGVRVPAQA